MAKKQYLDNIGLDILVDKIKSWVLSFGYTSNNGTITGISVSSPLSGGGTSGSVALTHENSGVSSGNYGDSDIQTPAFGETFKVNYESVNTTGHVTEISSHNVTIPDSVATDTDNGLMSADDKEALDMITSIGEINYWIMDENGNVLLGDEDNGFTVAMSVLCQCDEDAMVQKAVEESNEFAQNLVDAAKTELNNNINTLNNNINTLNNEIETINEKISFFESEVISTDVIPFAIYSEDDNTLTFYGGHYLPVNTYNNKSVTNLYLELECGNSILDRASWNDIASNVKKAVFDESFKDIKLTNLNYYFYDCTNLTEIDFTGLDASGLTSMCATFYHCESLTSIDLSSFDLSKVTNIGILACGCTNLTSINLNGFKNATLSTMNEFIEDCPNLTSIDVSPLHIDNVTNLLATFSGCSGLTTLDLSTWNTSKVTNMNQLFENCTNLKTIYSNDSNFVTTAVTSGSTTFSNCTSLVGGNGTKFDSSKITYTMAHVDTASNPGYFTAK